VITSPENGRPSIMQMLFAFIIFLLQEGEEKKPPLLLGGRG
jgi:hypothetical protein